MKKELGISVQYAMPATQARMCCVVVHGQMSEKLPGEWEPIAKAAELQELAEEYNKIHTGKLRFSVETR